MALNSANVDVAVTGALMLAPLGSTLPVDADTPLTSPYVDMGYVSDEGITETRERSVTNIIAWQNSDTVRAVVTESSIMVSGVLIETKKETVEFYYAATVNPTDGSVEIQPNQTGGRRVAVLDYLDGAKFVRLVLPQAENMEVGDLVYASGEPIGYEFTLTGYPDPTLGYSAKKFFSELVV